MDAMKMDKMNMAERYCALVLGITFLILGIAGFIPAFVHLPGTNASYVPPDVATGAYSAGFGYLFGAFPTNFLHNLVHCAVGIFGIASYTSASSARVFNRFFAVSYILIALLGVIPATNTVFGLMPIFGGNVLLNGLTAVAALYYGIILPAKVNDVGVARNI
ncbi:MAG: hypothetical protein CLLPBCKN_003243 [Chroococcidiopsis cubana SAG 39.79]|jgi:hypothetical protein|uniref:DUF4383 domain-containing protein n=2 Tax=Chroococcidiopsis TaxID=54298 RepID=K9TX54_CHRTP|nr:MULTISPECIES: DUF4383 domain-containing protein [Chroococcidiopsis]AFY86579.1 hypothetical protein Chro_1047 [Chroococcidiopsis thermalis PCC 7203]MDZ4873847.1 hypothetical protein [Chroococcidiopsis cubana SAG 39.79]RUT13487.1 membrane protein [Chroococcidiopsis cubana SAG 39.79]URD51463.1 DUF4383 domain-containing protein [Chroococcidiopsis sp. CCNUC1]